MLKAPAAPDFPWTTTPPSLLPPPPVFSLHYEDYIRINKYLEYLGSSMLQLSDSHFILQNSKYSLFSWLGLLIGQVEMPSAGLQQPPAGFYK